MKTKSFISEDVIQRIASGNESSQTLISMDVLKNVLKPHQLRNILGGSDDNGGSWYINCIIQCGEWRYYVGCSGLIECDDMAYVLCGDGGWTTNCY